VCRRQKGWVWQGCQRRSKSFTKDEGRPFEIGFQEQVSNHLKQLLLRVMVVSVEEKAMKKSSGRDQKDE